MSNTNQILSFINEKLPENGSTRVGLTIHVQLLKPLEGETVVFYFHTRMERLGHELDEDDFNNFVEQLISQLNVYCSGGSGWVVETLLAVEVKVAAPVRESGSSFIPTPAILRKTKNKKDEMCFLYSVLAALYPQKKHCDRPSAYFNLLDKMEHRMQDFPMCLSKIRFFEKRNDVSITVHRFDHDRLPNVCHSKNRASRKNLKLLLLMDESKNHYCLIKNFSNLMQKLNRSSKKRTKGPKSRFCGNCFQPVIRKSYGKSYGNSFSECFYLH